MIKDSIGLSQNNGIQLLRFVAASMVLFAHLPSSARVPFFGGESSLFLGSIGVDVFFCISGFVMYLSVGDNSGLRYAVQFGIRRAFRIIPLYFLLTVVLYLLLSFRKGDFQILASCLGSSLSFTYCGEGPHFGDPLIPMGWSLNYEMFFYVCLMIGVTIFSRGALRTVAAVLTVIAFFGWLTNESYYYFNSIIIEFCFGLLLGKYGPALKKSFTTGHVVCFAAISCILFFCAMLGRDYSVQNLQAVARMTISFGQFSEWPRWLVWGVPASLLTTSFYLLGNRVSHRVASLGDISYSLYLVQILTIAVYGAVIKYIDVSPQTSSPAFAYVNAIFIFGVTVGAAHILYRWVELPCMTYGKQLTARMNKRTRHELTTQEVRN